MRNYSLPFAAALVLLMACSLQAAEKPKPAQGNQTQPKKVWTNDDMDQLRARGLISVVGQEAAPPAAQAPAAPAEVTFPVYASRLDDPSWYADKAANLQAELDRRVANLQQEREALALAKNRITQPGIALDKPSIGVTPDAAIALLEAHVSDTQRQLDELSDLARQHDIPPGVLRGWAATALAPGFLTGPSAPYFSSLCLWAHCEPAQRVARASACEGDCLRGPKPAG